MSRRARLAQAPLANKARHITERLEQTGDGDVLLAQRDKRVAADGAVAGVLAGHEGAAAGSADGAAGVKLRELHPRGGQLVDVRRLDLVLAIAAEVAIAQIVGKDEDDVRLAFLARRARRDGDEPASDHQRQEQTYHDQSSISWAARNVAGATLSHADKSASCTVTFFARR